MKTLLLILMLFSFNYAKFDDSCRVSRIIMNPKTRQYETSKDTFVVFANFASGKEINSKTKKYELLPNSNFVTFKLNNDSVFVQVDIHLVTLGQFDKSALFGYREIVCHDVNKNGWVIMPNKHISLN